MKLFDWIFLLIYGKKLELDDLQYAYQPGFSTTMCTWSVLETLTTLSEMDLRFILAAWI